MNLRWISLAFGAIGLDAAAGLLGAGELHGAKERVSRHPGGAPRERTTFLDGERHGRTTRWYADGTLRAEGEFVRGRMEGEWRWYHPDGSPDPDRSGRYEDGRRVGPGGGPGDGLSG
jgi:hypothetical protein